MRTTTVGILGALFALAACGDAPPPPAVTPPNADGAMPSEEAAAMIVVLRGDETGASHPGVLEAANRALRGAGCDVVAVGNAAAAADILVSAAFVPDQRPGQQRVTITMSVVTGKQIMDPLSVQFLSTGGAIDDASLMELCLRWRRRFRRLQESRRRVAPQAQ